MTITLARQTGVAIVTLQRPPVNALDLPTILALEQTFLDLANDEPDGLVLTGQGAAFCAGVDTKAFADYGPAERKAMVLAITRMITALYALDVPTIAAAGGHGLGGGFVLMLGCDVQLVSAQPSARFGLTEAKAGVPFPAGPLELIRAELPAHLLGRLTLTSATLGADDLIAIGLAESVDPGLTLAEAAIQRVQALAAQPAFGVVKRQIRGEVRRRLAALVALGDDPFLTAFGAGG